MKQTEDLSRLRKEYDDRARRYAGSDVYSLFNPANLFAVQQRQRAILYFLKKSGKTDLEDLHILEMGCGDGGVLLEFQSFGAAPEKLHGIDLLEDRLEVARKRLPIGHIVNANGQHLPYTKNSFDVILQFTAVSSILDGTIRLDIFREMARVLKSDGLILSYDFFINPVNKQTRGLGLKEIRRAFPGWQIAFRRITLAPPIARWLIPFSWQAGLFLENLRVLNTHYLTAIRPGD